ncbi:UBX domain-containing protein 2B isoform X2 [Rhinatrema bivittatum]|uniref:UBX domain-containing protein 2B isoform X2 n=1 Tax=Rhinatrema bivittatum TaxID=194408 RepID=UPI0011290506|nr:UBX domain-containing protein 2B isoform X2 [Rhinatrema bivittatum]
MAHSRESKTGQEWAEESSELSGSQQDGEAGVEPTQRPAVRDLQLALARLYEGEENFQPSESDMPAEALAIDPENPVQRFYTGNSESSDLQMDAHSKKNDPGKIVNELFKQARELGAVPLDEALRYSDDMNKAKSFSGGGYKLGDSSQSRSEYIYGEHHLEFTQDVQIVLKLWRNGFSLDDGELRSYTDPRNTQFLESIKKGEIPLELQRLVHGGQVNLDMEDHQDKEYVKPRLKFKAFSGEGQKLGRHDNSRPWTKSTILPTQTMHEWSKSTSILKTYESTASKCSLTPEIVSTPSSPEEEHKSFLNAEVVVDELVPTTKIQIRLADGSRLIQRFNLTHRELSGNKQRCPKRNYISNLNISSLKHLKVSKQ